ncbi:MAG: HAD family phosphatase [Holdemanella sp.]|nr:HAD family phosphatase [Holdemanella sp.]
MIKNIVFDLGNVLVTFKPETFLMDLFHDDELVEALYSFLFVEHNYWNRYDQGILSAKDIINSSMKYKKEIELVMKSWVNYVNPVESSIDVLNQYKDQYNLYILSNIPEDCYRYLMDHHRLDKYVKGGVYSYAEKRIKPDLEIFKTLLNRYDLQAEETLFIDDHIDNIQAASQLGFDTIHLTDISQLKYRIEEKL